MQVVDRGTFVRAWAVQTKRFAWLLGAGASAAAGIPTATQIRDDLLLRVYAERHHLVREDLSLNDPNITAQLDMYFNGRNGMVEFGARDDYSRAFELALSDEPARRRYLQEKVEGRQPSYGQRVLGAFLSGGQTDIVVTTNFDKLVERAAADAYSAVLPPDERRLVNVAALGSRDRARAVLEPESIPMLIKLHGDFQESSLKNLESELATQDAVLRQSVHDLSRRYGLAVVGYSGRDDSVMDMLQSATGSSGAWTTGIWWCTRDPDKTPERVLELLAQASTNGIAAYLVRLGSFDELMGELVTQVELPTEGREFIVTLQPQNRLVAAAPPINANKAGPIIRYNALPILAAPTTALHASFGGLTRHEFRTRVKEVEFRGAAAMAGGALWGWGEEDSFAALAGSPAETKPIELTSGPLEPGLHALTLEGLTKALSAALPARPQISRREYAVLLAEWPDLSEDRSDALDAFKTAYQGDIGGSLAVAKYGINRDGGPRTYAEAIRLHLEFRWGLPWLIFNPFTWIEQREAFADRTENVDPVGDWIRERWVARKQNETWARLIDTWCTAIAPKGQESFVPMTRALGANRFGSFRIGPVSAYSRRST